MPVHERLALDLDDLEVEIVSTSAATGEGIAWLTSTGGHGMIETAASTCEEIELCCSGM
jgi:hypothetical protein